MTKTEPQQHPLTCWLLDTRSLWPVDSISDFSASAAEALELISPEEREACTRKYRIQDAKNSLASALLKRLFICKALAIPWKDVRLGRQRDPKHGKPCALRLDGSPAPLEFNISHQAGLVTLVGCTTAQVQLGVDIVLVNERNDFRVIDTEGFNGWVEMYAEIFSAAEKRDMKYNTDPFRLLDGIEVSAEHLGPVKGVCRRDKMLEATLPSGERRKFNSDLLIDAKLRRFYTYWCFKEAYIKLDGEALLAKWIAELEFRGVRAPRPGTVARCSTHGCWGERVGDTEVWLQGTQLENVKVEIVAFEEDYMISVAARPRELLPECLTAFESLHLEADVMEYAREANAEGLSEFAKLGLE